MPPQKPKAGRPTAAVGLDDNPKDVIRSCSSLLLIQILLEDAEHLADIFRSTEVGEGVGYGVVIFQAEQRRQLFLVKLINPDVHIMRQHEVEEDQLLRIEAPIDDDLGPGSPLLAGLRRLVKRPGRLPQKMLRFLIKIPMSNTELPKRQTSPKGEDAKLPA